MLKLFYALFCLLSIMPNSNAHMHNINNTKSLLIEHLFQNYNKEASPQLNFKPVHLNLSIALRAFKNIDQMDGTITSNVWFRYKWNDYRLQWDINEYNFSFISLNTNHEYDYGIWVPDIYLYNTAENPLSELDYSRAIVKNNGNILWSRPGMITSTCSFDLTHFPYDKQICLFKFGSWSYHGDEVNLNPGNPAIDISELQLNQEWDLVNYSYQKNTKYYIFS